MSSESNSIAVEWCGHSCFLLTLENGSKILTDPYDTTRLPYSLPADSVDLIFSTHDHFDHNAVKAIPSMIILKADGRKAIFWGSKMGVPVRLDDNAPIDLGGTQLVCSTIPSFHDDQQGKLRGANGIIRFTVGGLTFVHLGDLGEKLKSEQVEKLRPVDVLFVPVGGYYTIDAATAQEVVKMLEPRLVIPMHYKTDILTEGFPISGVEPFLQGFENIRRVKGSSITIRAGKLPENLTIAVLHYHGQK